MSVGIWILLTWLQGVWQGLQSWGLGVSGSWGLPSSLSGGNCGQLAESLCWNSCLQRRSEPRRLLFVHCWGHQSRRILYQSFQIFGEQWIEFSTTRIILWRWREYWLEWSEFGSVPMMSRLCLLILRLMSWLRLRDYSWCLPWWTLLQLFMIRSWKVWCQREMGWS